MYSWLFTTTFSSSLTPITNYEQDVISEPQSNTVTREHPVLPEQNVQALFQEMDDVWLDTEQNIFLPKCKDRSEPDSLMSAIQFSISWYFNRAECIVRYCITSLRFTALCPEQAIQNRSFNTWVIPRCSSVCPWVVGTDKKVIYTELTCLVSVQTCWHSTQDRRN